MSHLRFSTSRNENSAADLDAVRDRRRCTSIAARAASGAAAACGGAGGGGGGGGGGRGVIWPLKQVRAILFNNYTTNGGLCLWEFKSLCVVFQSLALSLGSNPLNFLHLIYH